MGAGAIAFLVIGAAAPLAAVVANVPLAIGLGDGKGVPGSFVIAGATLFLFSVGYAAMSRHITNVGAFFAYVSAGLGQRLGTAAGFVALLSYNLLVVYLVGLLGYFGRSTFQSEAHVTLPWELFAFGSLVIASHRGLRVVGVQARLFGRHPKQPGRGGQARSGRNPGQARSPRTGGVRSAEPEAKVVTCTHHLADAAPARTSAHGLLAAAPGRPHGTSGRAGAQRCWRSSRARMSRCRLVSGGRLATVRRAYSRSSSVSS